MSYFMDGVVDVWCGGCPILPMVWWMSSVVDVWCGGCLCGGCRTIVLDARSRENVRPGFGVGNFGQRHHADRLAHLVENFDLLRSDRIQLAQRL